VIGEEVMERKAFRRHLESAKHRRAMEHRARLLAKAEDLARQESERAAQRERLNAEAELTMSMVNPILHDLSHRHEKTTLPTEEEAQMWEEFDCSNNDYVNAERPHETCDIDVLQDLEEKVLRKGLWDLRSGQPLAADEGDILNEELDDEAVLSELMENAGEFYLVRFPPVFSIYLHDIVLTSSIYSTLQQFNLTNFLLRDQL
jgi:hypothetical protein